MMRRMAMAQLATEAEAAPTETPRAWPAAARASFRFAFVYLGLYTLTEMTMLFSQDTIAPADRLWLPPARWFAAHLLGLRTELRPNGGSGDTTFNYVQLLLLVIVAALAAAVWSIVDRRRGDYARLLEGSRLWLRYFLLCTMLSYGLAKIIPLQFPAPSPSRLLEPYGRSSPMGILWAFMGASGPYTRFAGAAELLGGVLIAFRRTALAGALVAAAVMTNVAMLNLCYDVCVKLFSVHVVLVAVLLVLCDRDRLRALFGAAVPAVSPTPLFASARARKIAWVAQSVAVLFAVGYHGWFTLKEDRDAHAPTSPLVGAYRVERLIKDGVVQPLLTTDAGAWRRAVISSWSLAIMSEDDTTRRYPFTPAKDGASLADAQSGAALAARRPDEGHLVLDGKLVDGATKKSSAIHLELARIDPSSWLLTNRGFHFINETPYNR